jgi:diadenosine tetraphosphate (Ap4A) HIT family hydrolase
MPIDYSDYNARTNGNYDKIWKSTDKCVFCDLNEKYIIAQNEVCVLTVNLFPYIDGTLLVVPKRHIEDLREINSIEWQAIQEMLNLGINKLEKQLNVSRIFFYNKNGLKSGGTVAHIHFLIIPYKEDLLKVNPQVITLSPIELAEKLRKHDA